MPLIKKISTRYFKMFRFVNTDMYTYLEYEKFLIRLTSNIRAMHNVRKNFHATSIKLINNKTILRTNSLNIFMVLISLDV